MQLNVSFEDERMSLLNKNLSSDYSLPIGGPSISLNGIPSLLSFFSILYIYLYIILFDETDSDTMFNASLASVLTSP